MQGKIFKKNKENEDLCKAGAGIFIKLSRAREI